MAKKIEPASALAGIHRTERVLAYAAITVAVLSAVCIVIFLIGGATHSVSATGIWPAVAILPVIGFPIAIILIIVFIVVSTIRRRRDERSTAR